jgi:hypothetical protein
MSSPHRLRRFAACVLLVWLFGLASGIVNACIVSSQLRQSDAGEAATVLAHAAVAGDEMAAMDHDMAGHDHGAKTQPRACERLCDAPAAVPDKTVGQALGAFWLAPAPLPAVAVRPLAQVAAVPPSNEPRWAATVPISIAFLRLAL